MFTYGSICSGIEAVSCAWDSFAKPLWFSEIEPFPCAVLAYRYPNIPNLGDMTALPEKILNQEIPAPGILVGGTPCQSFSIAGNRKSLDDARGNLTLSLIHILEAIDYVRFKQGKPPCILVWENVPGVLSTKDNAFGHFLAGLVQEPEPLQPSRGRWLHSGYVHGKRTIAWRTLDAQYFGVPQRRKRIFLVASARAESIAEILFERKSLSGHSGSEQETQQTTTAFVRKYSKANSQPEVAYAFQTCFNNVNVEEQLTPPILASQAKAGNKGIYVCHGSQDPIVNDKTAHCLGRNNGLENVLFEIKGQEAVRLHSEVCPTLKARMGTGGNNVPCIAIAGNTIGRSDNAGGNGKGFDESGVSYTLTTNDIHAVCWNGDATPKFSVDKALTLIASQGGEGIGVAHRSIVRKLTPVECERLQGFPDNWTKVPYRNKPIENCPESPRYKAIGNSMAVPVMRWIGLRINNFLG